MAKKKFHVIKYINHKAFLFNNDYEAFIKERKQAKGAVTKGFNEFEKSIEWIGDLPYEIIVQKDTKTLSLAPTAENKKITYYAVVRGRRVGVMKSHAAFMEATKGYKNAKAKGGFKTKKQAVEWLAKQGISPENKKGIYVVVRGFQTGVFIDLHSYEKNLSGYPNAIGQGGFRNIEIATNWLNKQKNANQKNTNVKKEQKEVRSSTEEQLYHAIVIGKETGIFTDRNQYEENLKGIPNSWGKDGFQSKKEATEWLNERLTFIQKNITKEQIISFESKNLPVIYTDGSYIKDEKTYSSSVIICEEEGTIATFAKGNKKEANNKIAEVEALLYALKLVVDFYDFRRFILVYDFDGLDKIATNSGSMKKIPAPLANEITEIIHKNRLDIYYINVKSHTGIVGNTAADCLAKTTIKQLAELKALKHPEILDNVGNN